jgi:glyceraldehyde 3-phosphate dehydrogenase
VALRLAINGLGRITSQLVRVVDQGGFSDLFEIAAIHDPAGPDGIVRALRNDSIYGPFPREMTLEGETLTIGEQSIALSSQAEAKNSAWGKADIPLVIVDGSSARDASALDQHLKKGARKVILPTASPLASINLGIGINEESYDPEAHEIVASAAGAPSAISMFYQLIDSTAKVRVGSATVLAPTSGQRSMLDTPAARGGSGAIVPVIEGSLPVYEQLVGKLTNRLSVNTFEAPAAAVGSISFGVWLEQRVTEESLREMVSSAAQGEDLIGLIGVQEAVSASSDVLRDSRSLVVDWSGSRLLYETFVTLKGWYDAEWGAACRLADLLALICEEGVPGTA